MRQLDTFVMLCRLAIAKDGRARDREAATALIRMRQFSSQTLGEEGAERARSLRAAVLLQVDGGAPPGHGVRIQRLIAQIERLPDYQPDAPYWARERE